MSAWVPIVAALSAVGLLTSTACHLLVWVAVKRKSPSAGRAISSAVTVLKPLCGVDGQLRENLEAFARQSHRDLRLVLGVARRDDAALPVAERFRDEHPDLDVRVCIGESSAINPKVALLERMCALARGPWVVVSDSNVRVDPDYVSRSLRHAAEGVGLVTHLVAGAGGDSAAAHYENLQLNCFVAPGVCGARFIAGRTCVIGKSMFLRRSVLDEMGGFGRVGGYLAEDYATGIAVERAGHRVATADVPVRAWHAGWTLARFLNRHVRWAVMRRSVSPLAYLYELFLTPGPLLTVLFALSMVSREPLLAPGWIGLALVLQGATVAITYWRMSGLRVPLLALALNPIREWLTVAIWVVGWFVHEVAWRGSPYRVGRDSVLEAALPPLSQGLPDEA